MKRARKYPIKPDQMPREQLAPHQLGPEPLGVDPSGVDLSGVVPSGVVPSGVVPSGLEAMGREQIRWIGFASDQNEPETELDWVRTSLELQFNVVTTRIKQSSDAGTEVAQWLERNHLTNAASPVFISSRYRSDNLVEVINSLKSNLPACEIYCILGQWWVGHKRTLPLPSGNQIFYWYEFYDLLLPEMKKSQQLAKLLGSATSNRVMSESALVCSNDSELRRMWGESLRHHDIHTVAIIDFDAIPESQFNYILVDADSNQTPISSVDGNFLESLLRLVATLRRRYPKSIIATLMGFPEWQASQAVLQSGANMIVGKPCRVAGLVSSLRSFTMQ